MLPTKNYTITSVYVSWFNAWSAQNITVPHSFQRRFWSTCQGHYLDTFCESPRRLVVASLSIGVAVVQPPTDDHFRCWK